MTREEAKRYFVERVQMLVEGADKFPSIPLMAYEMAIEALSEPSGDLISRKNAKEETYLLGRKPSISVIWDCLDALPSAEAKIVLCKDCKHLYKDGECPLRTWRTHTEDDYCSYGERREDGEA